MGVITRNSIVTNGLVLYLDARNPSSLISGSTRWIDLTRTITSGSLQNTASYSSENGGTVLFTKTGSNASLIALTASVYNEWTINTVVKPFLNNAKSSQTLVYISPTATNTGYFHLLFAIFYNLQALAVDNSGSIYIGGQYGGYQSTVRSFVTKINSTGGIDTNFDLGITPGSVNDITTGGIVFDSSGSAYIAGTNVGQAGIRKINRTTGAYISDPTFASGGSTNIAGGNLLLDETTNSLYVCGVWTFNYQSSASGYFLKLNTSDYTRNFTFDTTTGFNSNDVRFMAFNSSKDIYLAGGFTSYKGTAASRIVKVNGTTAAIDFSFNYGTGFNNTSYFVIVQADNKPIVGGTFTSYSGSTANRIVRLNTDGTVDSTFNTGTGFSSAVYSAKLQADGKIVAVGAFTTYSGSTVNRIVRLNTNGTIDNTFNTGTGFNNECTELAIQSDGKILVLSAYATTYSGSLFNSIIRLNTDGTIDTTFNAGLGVNLPLYRQNVECYLTGSTYQFVGAGLFLNDSNRLLLTQISPSWLDKYHNLTVTFGSDKNFRFYYNGVLKNTVAATSGLIYPLKTDIILSNENSYMSFFSTYNRALTPQEVLQNYNAIKTRFGLT